MNFFGRASNLNIDYRRLMPSASQDSMDTDFDYGVYEDEETQRARRQAEATEGGAAGAHNPVVQGLQWIADQLPELSLRERLLGCATCMVCGYLLSFGSFMRMRYLLGGNPVPLVLNVTAGNILTLCGTCFLTGPTAQVGRMWHTSRRGATLMYIGSIWMTVILLFMPHFVTRGFILFCLMIFQYVAITWYCLSYIPFARDIVKNLCRRLMTGRGSSSILEDDG